MSKPDEQAIFHTARRIEAPEARREYLASACGDEQKLRARVEALLRVHDEERSFLRAPAEGLPPRAALQVSEGPGATIGPYKLLEPIGEGGCGVVFMAEQRQPVRRKVALKLIKPGMDTKQVVARFEAERQALALMDHPNIAKVLDGGETASGRPYFVMELVRGVPVTDFCDRNHFTVRQRLELFVSLCRAVQHAHTKGIIHRDLKPSNVLVTLHDSAPVVKVIDFGVAKSLRQGLTDKTLFTAFTQMVGTPLYMSPEQAEMSGLDVDTRSDIYSLGVLLYELLTGTTPFDQERLRMAAFDEVRRIIREEEPPRPSARISTLAEGAATVSVNRGSEPRQLSRLFRGELDWIVMKCLEKDRTRRYETANALARDVQRYLADEPVQACPPTAGYRLRKVLRRHRGAALAAAVVLLALLGGIVGTTIGLLRAEQAWRAEAERAEGERAARETAAKRLAQVEKGIDVLGSIFEDLDPREEKVGRPLRKLLGERLLEAAKQLDGEAVGDPVVSAHLQNRLGRSLMHLGMTEPAIELFLKARQTQESLLGKDHPDTLQSMNNLALAYKSAGKIKLALPLQEEAYKRRRETLGPDHPDTLVSMNNLGAAYRDSGKPTLAVPLHEEALRRRRATLGRDHPDTLISMSNLAMSYHVAGKLNRAVPLYEQTLRLREAKLGREHFSTITSMNNLALGYTDVGRLDRALVLQEVVFRLRKTTVGHDHPDTLTSMNNLAMSYKAVEKLDLALPLLEKTLELTKARQGPEHPETLVCMSNLALGLQAAGKLDQALPLFEKSLTLRRVEQGPDHPGTLNCMSNLALCLQAAGKLDQALPLFEESAHRVEKRAYQMRQAGRIINSLAGCLEEMKRFPQAEEWRRKWLAAVKEKDGSESPSYADELTGLGANLLLQKKHEEAERVLRESLAVLQKQQPESWITFHTQSLLGGVLLGQQKYADAEPLLVQGYQGMKARAAKIPKDQRGRLSQGLERLVQLHEARGNKSEAERLRQELADERPSRKE